MQVIAQAVEYVCQNSLTIIGAAFTLSIVIGLLREAITGESK